MLQLMRLQQLTAGTSTFAERNASADAAHRRAQGEACGMVEARISEVHNCRVPTYVHLRLGGGSLGGEIQGTDIELMNSSALDALIVTLLTLRANAVTQDILDAMAARKAAEPTA